MRPRRPAACGFSLIETLLGLALAIGLGGVLFHLFSGSRQAFGDEALLAEMRQSAHAVAGTIAREIGAAGQGVPLFAVAHEAVPREDLAVFLEGTGPGSLVFRADLTNREARMVGVPPVGFEVGRTRRVTLADPGGDFRAGERVFLWGAVGPTWIWVRARVEAAGGSELIVMPEGVSTEGGTFTGPGRITAEDAVSYRLFESSVLRGELVNLSDPDRPVFRELSIGEGFESLEFIYYDKSGAILDASSPPNRLAIRRIDFRLEAATSGPLSDGRRRTYPLSVSVGPRNLTID
jgi:hypothetical protein